MIESPAAAGRYSCKRWKKMIFGSWTNYIAAFAVFFASHMVLVRPPVRPVLVSTLTPRGFSLAYSLLSIVILWWLIEAAAAAPYIELWGWQPWQNDVPRAVMLPVCVILAFGVAVPNPFSFGGVNNSRFNPEKPGIVKWIRHPVLMALFLWSAAHLVPNGDLAHVILFSAFALFSLLGMKLIDRRRQRELGDQWSALLAASRNASARKAISLRALFLRGSAALLAYGALALLHPYFAGVDPLV